MCSQFLPEVQQAIDTVNGLVTAAPAGPMSTVFREIYRQMAPMGGAPEPLYRIEDILFPGSRLCSGPGPIPGSIPLRIYRPSPTDDLAVLVFFHGGSFCMGDLETHDIALRSLANAAGCLIVAVDYRLAPEHPYPAALEDCYAAMQWVATHAKDLGAAPHRLAIAGDSAGGLLAAAVALRAVQNKGPRLSFQALIYPLLSLQLSSPSWEEFADGPIITREGVEQGLSYFIPNEADRLHPDLHPLTAKHLPELPPTLIITAEFDPVRDDGAAYAKALSQAGVETTYSEYKGMIHGFALMAGIIPDGRRAIEEIAAAIRRYCA
jgi:acetyl esterase